MWLVKAHWLDTAMRGSPRPRNSGSCLSCLLQYCLGPLSLSSSFIFESILHSNSRSIAFVTFIACESFGPNRAMLASGTDLTTQLGQNGSTATEKRREIWNSQ